LPLNFREQGATLGQKKTGSGEYAITLENFIWRLIYTTKMEAAIYSSQGDEYQRLIALHWVVHLLSDAALAWVQIEAIAHPDTQERILIEDVVIAYKDGHKTAELAAARKILPN
jgi:hypothetical protein